jgi:alpha-tubulin suppressor-like RCC1 family protein
MIITVAAGGCHTLAVTLEGHVYGWGTYKVRIIPIDQAEAWSHKRWSVLFR